MSENIAPRTIEEQPPHKATQILLYVDPILPVSPGRVFTIRGIAASKENIKDISISYGGRSYNARHGLFRPELAKAYPQQVALGYSGFSAVIRVPESAKPGKSAVISVAVRTRADNERIIWVPLEIIEADLLSSDRDPNIELPALSSPFSGQAMHLVVENAVVDRAGLLRVGGWVVSYSRIETVEVTINDQFGGQAHTGVERDDVANAWPDYPNAAESGFLFVTDAASFEGRLQVKVTATAMGGVVREATIQVDRGENRKLRNIKETHKLTPDLIMLSSDGVLHLRGWAVSSGGILEIRVLSDDEIVGIAEFGAERPDVGNVYPTLPGSRQSGFNFTGVIDKANLRDEHVLTLEMVLREGNSQSFKVAVVPKTVAPVEEPDGSQDILVEIDEPVVNNGAATQPVTGGLSIGGWALSKDGITSVKVELDQVYIGDAYYGMRRQDIEAAFPGWKGALLSGYAFSIPQRLLTEGRRSIRLTASTAGGKGKTLEFTVEISKGQEQQGPWLLRKMIPLSEQLLLKAIASQLPEVRFLVSLSCDGCDLDDLRATLSSLDQQVYPNWQLLLVGSPASLRAANTPMKEFSAIAPKIVVGSQISDKWLEPAWILPLDAGDVLSCDALFEFASNASLRPETELIYADERCPNPASDAVEAFFKPDWSPDLLLSTNYIGRPWCAKASLMRAADLTHSNPELPGRYAAVLRTTELAKGISHIPKVLCERPPTRRESKKEEIAALREATYRRNMKVSVRAGRVKHSYRLKRRTEVEGLVSIIIPTCAARGLVKTCLDSLRTLSTYKNIEVICIDNIFDETNQWKSWLRENADVVVEVLEPFNWSRFNNLGAKEATGSYLLFLNDDIQVIQPDWLEAMLAPAAEDGVGVVGPQLLYPDRKVQHAGLFLAGDNSARHAFRFCQENDPGYFGLALTQRNMIEVTGACLLVKRSVYDQLGGFEEAHAVVNNDLDFCLRSHAAGFRNVYTPFATLVHHELASRATMEDVHDVGVFRAQWASMFAHGDPFFHPNLSRSNDTYQYEAEPACAVYSGHPLYLDEDVKRILVVKLDHIGDFLTALPAIQRLKQHFPEAEIHVLAAPAAQTLAALELSIEQIIPFEFFHARSGLGQKEVGEVELEGLRTKLLLYNFDLAIDLRKHPDTRKVLQYTGAKITAGFDHKQQNAWLDISIPWEGDERFQPKRQHVADDLINLVDAVKAAGIKERSVIRKPEDWRKRQLAAASELFKDGLFDRKVVCIHPASGTEMRQWPPRHFATLIDMLVERADANIVIVGGPDEKDIADAVISSVRHKERLTSMVGRLKLVDLAPFLDCCALFVGNNSGPKHLAAALGVPTIGIHSGVVDPREWGPLGRAALAVKREMTCAPCYLAKREDCHRGLTCLTGLQPNSLFIACLQFLQLNAGPLKDPELEV